MIVVPTFAEESLTSWMERFVWYERVLVRLPVDIVVTLLVGGVIGVLEVTLAHALIADQRRRREARRRPWRPPAPAAPAAARPQDADR